MDLGARLGVNFAIRLEWHEESDRDHSSEFAIVFLYNRDVEEYVNLKVSKKTEKLKKEEEKKKEEKQLLKKKKEKDEEKTEKKEVDDDWF